MGHIRTNILKKLKGLKPIDQIFHLYSDKSDFTKDLENYLLGGYVHSCDDFFVMAKPVDDRKDPMGQWYAKRPNCWFVRWASTKTGYAGGLKKMMDSVKPLEWVMFKRIREDDTETEYRVYRWSRLYEIVAKV